MLLLGKIFDSRAIFGIALIHRAISTILTLQPQTKGKTNGFNSQFHRICLRADRRGGAYHIQKNVWRICNLLWNESRGVGLRRPALRQADKKRQSLYRQGERSAGI